MTDNFVFGPVDLPWGVIGVAAFWVAVGISMLIDKYRH
jgi:hypothetical protein